MKFLSWALRLALIFPLVLFALANTELVVLRLWPGQMVEAPLVVLVLAVLGVGLILGVLSMLPTLYRQRRELRRLHRQGADRSPAVAKEGLSGDSAAQ